MDEQTGGGYPTPPCVLPRRPDGTLDFRESIYRQTGRSSFQTGGSEDLDDEPVFFVVPQWGTDDCWALIVRFDDRKIAEGRFTGADALARAFAAANTIHDRFHARHHRSGTLAHYSGLMACKHLGTMPEGDLEICDHCHRIVNGFQYTI
ncbi:hypothetical protein [Nocardia transvalensis]|uniref:hypothetical protein n=1 Tax=Nocardia transvalensis TaxID=37333 RepID=UPI0018935A8A|nr:hypothetical protein [Nocardia transvalensis]MBF6333607.1 hypothetical protein [Nocardia transvalensis]